MNTAPLGDEASSSTPTSFFRNISERLANSQQQQQQQEQQYHHHKADDRGAGSGAAVPYCGASTPSQVSSVSPSLTGVSASRGDGRQSPHAPASLPPQPPPAVGSTNLASTANTFDVASATMTTSTTRMERHEVHQMTSALMTQAVQQQQPMPSRSYIHRSPSREAGGGGGDGSANRVGHSNGTVEMQRGGSSVERSRSGNPYSSNGHGAKQRVHAYELVERARYIRNQPKNTSPVNAADHPSLLPPPDPSRLHRKCLILDVDETLVHSSYQCPPHYDLHLVIDLDDENRVDVYVAFRPHLQEFLEAIAPLFEVVIFTASLSKYCHPLMDAIDQQNILGDLRLFREHCSLVGSTFVKDLSLLGRDLDTVAIIDNSPVAYLFQQRNAIPITSWFDDQSDTELSRLIPVLEALAEASSVYDVLDNYNALLQLQQQQQQQHLYAEGGYLQ